MSEITTRIVRFCIDKQIIDEADKDIYKYGMELLLENISISALFLTVGCAIGKGMETSIFLCTFCWLRKYCGGYHAETKKGCHRATVITYIFFLIGVMVFETGLIKCIKLLYGICLVIVIAYIPVEHKNKVLTRKIKLKNKKRGIGCTVFLGVIIFLFEFKLPMVSFAVLVTLIEVALLIIIGRRKNYKKIKNCKINC